MRALLLITVSVLVLSCKNDDEATPALAIGDFHEGGIIFYLDDTGLHGMVCDVRDQSTGMEWGCGSTLVPGTSVDIGTGMANTTIIVAVCPDNTSAADLAADFVLGEYDDWYLPSKDELNEMYINKSAINATAATKSGTALSADFYWSSTQPNIYYAWTQNFDTGEQISDSKSNIFDVRCVRSF